MDLLVNLANKYNFVRLSTSLQTPIVFHCVPGAGKSTLIRELLAIDSRFSAFTAGEEDQPNLTGCFIRKYTDSLPNNKFILLDEYTRLPNLPDGIFAVFGDPLQTENLNVLRAHFTSKLSRRFGGSTAVLLRELGFDIEASGADVVQISDIFSIDPSGVIVYFEEEIGCLLRQHCVEAHHSSSIVGKTFREVTFVTTENSPLLNRTAAFQCLTRHQVKLNILCPNATYSSA